MDYPTLEDDAVMVDAVTGTDTNTVDSMPPFFMSSSLYDRQSHIYEEGGENMLRPSPSPPDRRSVDIQLALSSSDEDRSPEIRSAFFSPVVRETLDDSEALIFNISSLPTIRSGKFSRLDINEPHINLSFHGLFDSDIIELSSLLCNSGPTLQSINLEGNDMHDEGAVSLASALTASSNSVLSSIDLKYNYISDVGVAMLIKKLFLSSNYPKKLSTLNLNCNQIGSNVCQLLSQALSNNTALRILRIGGNCIQNDGIRLLGAALATNTTLEVLDVSSNGIKGEGTVDFANSLTINKSILEIDYRDNVSQDSGMVAFASLISVHPKLVCVNLSGVGAGDVAVSHMVSVIDNYLRTNPVLENGPLDIDLRRNACFGNTHRQLVTLSSQWGPEILHIQWSFVEAPLDHPYVDNIESKHSTGPNEASESVEVTVEAVALQLLSGDEGDLFLFEEFQNLQSFLSEHVDVVTELWNISLGDGLGPSLCRCLDIMEDILVPFCRSPQRVPQPGMGVPFQSIEELPVILRNSNEALPLLYELLTKTSESNQQLMTTTGLISPVFGVCRVKILDFICIILELGCVPLTTTVSNCRFGEYAVSLFSAYPWNSCLHNSLSRFLGHCLETRFPSLHQQVIGPLIQLCLDYGPDQTIRKRPVGFRGHLLYLSTEIERITDAQPELRSMVTAYDAWAPYITAVVLPINEQNKKSLGGDRPEVSHNSGSCF